MLHSQLKAHSHTALSALSLAEWPGGADFPLIRLPGVVVPQGVLNQTFCRMLGRWQNAEAAASVNVFILILILILVQTSPKPRVVESPSSKGSQLHPG